MSEKIVWVTHKNKMRYESNGKMIEITQHMNLETEEKAFIVTQDDTPIFTFDAWMLEYFNDFSKLTEEGQFLVDECDQCDEEEQADE